MPKNKTRRAVSKRFKITGTGKLVANGCGMRHNLEHKSAHKRRALSTESVVSKPETKPMKKLLGI